MNNEMHLCDITFQEVKVLTKALSESFQLGAQQFVKDINTILQNPNAQGVSWVAKKLVAEWQADGHDADKIEASIKDILKKAAKNSK